MTESQHRAVTNALLVSSVVAACLICTWIAISAAGLTAPTYNFQFALIVQGRSKVASSRASIGPMVIVAKWLGDLQTRAILSTSQVQALALDGSPTQNWITITHYGVTSRRLAKLDQLEYLMKSKSVSLCVYNA